MRARQGEPGGATFSSECSHGASARARGLVFLGLDLGASYKDGSVGTLLGLLFRGLRPGAHDGHRDGCW